jgi:hypothetical protein
LAKVYKDQPDEHETDIAVVGDPHVQKLERAECGGSRAQQADMDCPP